MSDNKTQTNRKVRHLVEAALIGALYAGLTYIGAGIAYGPVQFRASEALIVLSVFTPAAIPGLTVGCLLANLTSTYGIADIVFGTLATFLSALFAYKTRKIRVKGLPLLSPLGSVVFNAVIIGLMISFMEETPALFWIMAGEILLSQAIVCYLIGIPLYCLLKKSNIFS